MAISATSGLWAFTQTQQEDQNSDRNGRARIGGKTMIEKSADALQAAARRHLWMHFTRLSAYAEREIPIIVRAEGAYVWDSHGRRCG